MASPTLPAQNDLLSLLTAPAPSRELVPEELPPAEFPPVELPVEPQVDRPTALAMRLDKLIMDSQSDATRGVNQQAQITDYLDTTRDLREEGVEVVPEFTNVPGAGGFAVSDSSYGGGARRATREEVAKAATDPALSQAERNFRIAEAGQQAAVEALTAAQTSFVGSAEPLLAQLAQLDQVMASPDLTPGGRTAAGQARNALARQADVAAQQDEIQQDRVLKPLQTQLAVAQQRWEVARQDRARDAPLEAARREVAGVPQEEVEARMVATGLPRERVMGFRLTGPEAERTARAKELRRLALGDAWAADPARQGEEDLMWRRAQELKQGTALDAEQQAIFNQTSRLKRTAMQSPDVEQAVAAARQAALDAGETKLSAEGRRAAQRAGAMSAYPRLVQVEALDSMLKTPVMLEVPGNQTSIDIVARYEELSAPRDVPILGDLVAAANEVSPQDSGRQLELMLQTFISRYNTDIRGDAGLDADATDLKRRVIDLTVRAQARAATQALIGLGPSAELAAPIPQTPSG